MQRMADHQNTREAGHLTTEQAKALLAAWPLRVPYFNDEQIIQCTACRHYFASGKAWKAHRRAGTCNPTHLIRNDLGIWRLPARKRVRVQP